MSSSPGAQLRWGSGTRSKKSSEAKTRLLDAAMDCYRRLGASASLSDIAAQAKITRTTVYRYFPNQHEILKAVVRREVDKLLAQMHADLQHIDNFGDYLVEGLLYTLRNSAVVDFHKPMQARDSVLLMHEIVLADRGFLIDLTESMRPVYERLKIRSRIPLDLDLMKVCEWYSRIAISYLGTPSPVYQSEEELRELFRSMVALFFLKRR